MAISTARQFFDDLVADGVTAIEALVTDAVHETEWLDFKSGEHLSDDKVTWSEAICGFGNNQGGVLIWGVDARKDKATGIDAAYDVKPVENPAALRSRLLELLRGAVEPPLPGVEVRDFLRPDGKGFVVCFIPESRTKPHRAESVANKPYKIRIADAFINPSVSLLRSLFFPSSNPKIQIDIFPDWTPIEYGGPEPREIEIRYKINVRNTGVVTARDLFVVVRTKPSRLAIELPYSGTKIDVEDAQGIEFGRPLHPSSYAKLCNIRHPVGAATLYGSGQPRYAPHVNDIAFEAEFDIFGTDMVPIRLATELGDLDIHRRHPKTAFERLD